jgi:hypothetical protein
MNTSREHAGGRFWMWIGLAFSLGIVVGLVLAVVGPIVLQALIS